MMLNNVKRLAAVREFILGSGSPRRRQLLEENGISFRIVVPHVTETISVGESAVDYARRLAEEKALAAAASQGSGAVTLGCDTIVILEGHVLEKPVDKADALRMLRNMSGQTHTVCTALALVSDDRLLASDTELSDVRFHSVTEEQLLDYVASGEPLDKAGAYGIQAKGAFLVDSVEGHIDNVIGLPLTLLERIAGEALLQLQPIRDDE